MPLRRRRRLFIAGALLLLVFAAITVCVVALLKLGPTAKAWAEAAISGRNTSVRETVGRVATALGSERAAAALVRLGVDPSVLAALGAKQEFATLLNAVSAVPQLGALVRDGAYRDSLAEGVRQRAATIMEVQIDQVSSPAVRDAIVRVQTTLREAGATGVAVANVDARMLELLTRPEFTRLLQNVEFGRYLSGPQQDVKAVD